MKILAIKFKQIGDVLLCEPALRKIKEIFHEAELHFLTYEASAQLIKNAPYIDKLIMYKKKSSGIKSLWKDFCFYKTLSKAKYDLIIGFSEGERTSFVSLFSRAKKRIGILAKKHKKWQDWVWEKVLNPPDTHTVLKNLWIVNQVLSGLGYAETSLKDKKISVNLYLTQESITKAEKFLKKEGIFEKDEFVCVHPVAKWFLKCWPAEYYPIIIKWFLKNGLKVVITGSKEKRELEFIKKILKELEENKGVINLAGKLNLLELAGIISKAKFFFGIDTAPMHIAAALNKPVVAIFGPTGKHNWGPWENDKIYNSWESPYKKRGTQKWGKHLVFQKDWECVPCGGKKSLCRCDLKAPKCLTELHPSLVIDELKNFL